MDTQPPGQERSERPLLLLVLSDLQAPGSSLCSRCLAFLLRATDTLCSPWTPPGDAGGTGSAEGSRRGVAAGTGGWVLWLSPGGVHAAGEALRGVGSGALGVGRPGPRLASPLNPARNVLRHQSPLVASQVLLLPAP